MGINGTTEIGIDMELYLLLKDYRNGTTGRHGDRQRTLRVDIV